MKKFLGIALALALVTPSGSASAEVLKNLKVSGALDFQANSARNVRDFSTTNYDRVGDAITRVIVNTNWDLLDDIHANVTMVKNDRAWGHVGNAGQVGGAGSGSAGAQPIGTAGANVLGSVYVQQANVKVDKMIGQFDATIGRQFFGEPGDLIAYFGPKNAYGMWVTAVDAFRLDWANDMLGVTGLGGKMTTGGIGTTAGTETDLRHVNVAVKNLPVKLDAYVWNTQAHKNANWGTNASKNDFLWVYGVKAKAEMAGAWLKAEIAMNSGQNRANTNPGGSASYLGKALLAELGYKADVSNVGAFTPWGTFGWGSGRHNNLESRNETFTAIASDFRPGIINGRFNGAGSCNLSVLDNGATATDVSTVGLGNRVVYGAGLKVTPAMADKLVLGLSFWDFSVQKATAKERIFYRTGADNPNEFHAIRHIGSEFGVTADWKHSENVQYGIGYANFQPGGLIKVNNQANARGNNPVQFAFADLSLKF